MLEGCPLITAHRAGARVCQQVDHYVAGRQLKQVVVSGSYRLLAFGYRRHWDRLDRVDPKRLDDRLIAHDKDSRSTTRRADTQACIDAHLEAHLDTHLDTHLGPIN